MFNVTLEFVSHFPDKVIGKTFSTWEVRPWVIQYIEDKHTPSTYQILYSLLFPKETLMFVFSR